MKEKKSTKPYVIFSENEKMDTSGMANKPMDFSEMVYEYSPPKMPVQQMVQKYSEKKGNKK